MADSPTMTSLVRLPEGIPQLTVRSLVLIDAESTAVHRFEAESVRIGSADDNDLVLKDPGVSRHHCRIFIEGGRHVIRDERSKNGTLVNDVPIREAFLLPDARLRLGSTTFRFGTDERLEAIANSKKAEMGGMVGTSEPMRRAFALIERIAPMDATVVVLGETGTGKELAARAVHEHSRRKDGPLVVVDCGAIHPNLVASELFGHERGAFTGADQQKIGAFEAAKGGTVFLDELGELPLELQVNLLRVLERREIKRVGAERYIPVDCRVVAATHRNLVDMVEAGTLREDLFYRLDVVSVTLPPLRERTEDIGPLLDFFLLNLDINVSPDGDRKVRRVSPAALEVLERWPWPGNVRELKHAAERAIGLGDGDTLETRDLPPRMVPESVRALESSDGRSFKEAKRSWVDAFAKDYLVRLLERHDGNVNAAAEEADLHPKYLRQLMSQYGV
ncbi:MAG: sigma 54-interacting transcriptional regulator [Sandaracinaceae bacterium]